MSTSTREGTGPGLREMDARPLRFTTLNWALLGLAAVVIVAGYLSLAAGSTTLAPVLLVLGYCVLVPLGIFV
ncbi:MAG: hypothetical protein ACREKI_07950 [Gemmatimonadota bacterium]